MEEPATMMNQENEESAEVGSVVNRSTYLYSTYLEAVTKCGIIHSSIFTIK